MGELEVAVRELQDRIAQAQRARARAEVEREAATAARDMAAARLREEFGVGTALEGRALLTRLEAELAEGLGRVAEALDSLVRDADDG